MFSNRIKPIIVLEATLTVLRNLLYINIINEYSYMCMYVFVVLQHGVDSI